MYEFDVIGDGLIRLGIGIVKQAARDYRDGWREYLLTGVKSPLLLEVERWFTSSHGKLLSYCNGEMIMRFVRENLDTVLIEEDE